MTRLPKYLLVVLASILLTTSAQTVGEGPWECLWGTGCFGGTGEIGGITTEADLTDCLEQEQADVICILDSTVAWELDEYDWDPYDVAGPQSAVIDCNGATINRATGALSIFKPDPGTPTNDDDTLDTFWLTIKNCIFTASDQPGGGNVSSFADGGGGTVLVTTSANHGLADEDWVRIWNDPHLISGANGVTYAEMWYADTSGLAADEFKIPATWVAGKAGATAAQWSEVRAILATNRLAPATGGSRYNVNGIKFIDNVYDWQGSLEGSTVIALMDTAAGDDYAKNMNLIFRGNAGYVSTRADSGGVHEHSVGGLKSVNDSIRAFDEVELCEYWGGHETVLKQYPPQDIYMIGDEWYECGGWFYTTRFSFYANMEATSIGQFVARAPFKIAGAQTFDLTMRVGGEFLVNDDRWYSADGDVTILKWILTNQTFFPSSVRVRWDEGEGCVGMGASRITPFFELEDGPSAGGSQYFSPSVTNISVNAYGANFGCYRPTMIGPLVIADWGTATGILNRTVQGLVSQRVIGGFNNILRSIIDKGVLYDVPNAQVRYGADPPANTCSPGQLFIDTTPNPAGNCATTFVGQLCTCSSAGPPGVLGVWVAVNTEAELETQIGVNEVFTDSASDFTAAQFKTGLVGETGTGNVVFQSQPLIFFPSGSSAPASCTIGEIYVCTGGGGTCCTGAGDICTCTNTNNWTLNGP